MQYFLMNLVGFIPQNVNKTVTETTAALIRIKDERTRTGNPSRLINNARSLGMVGFCGVLAPMHTSTTHF